MDTSIRKTLDVPLPSIYHSMNTTWTTLFNMHFPHFLFDSFFSDFGYGFFQSWIYKFLKFFLRFVFQTLIRTLLYTEVIRAKTTHGKGESHWKTEIGIARSRYLLTRYLSFIIVVAFTWTNFQVILLTCYFHFISSSKTVVS